jgi:sugar phosphate isomerase/epimerase
VLADDREKMERELCEIVDYAVAIGAKLFHHTLMPYLRLDLCTAKYEEIFPKVLDVERKIVKYCSERGLNCIFEPQGLYFNGVDGLSKIIYALREEFPEVGLCADLGNSIDVDCDPVDVMKALGGLAKHVHIKDYIVSDESLGRRGEIRSPAGKYLNEVLPGEGELRLVECLQILKASGYDGRIALEYLGDDETILKSMEYIKALWR